MSLKERAGEWRLEVFTRDLFRCVATYHAPDCSYRAEHAHHAVYLSHLTAETRYLTANGVSLSSVCHAEAHRTHNANIETWRLRAAVDAVNAIIEVSKNPELRRPHFREQSRAKEVSL